MITFDRRQAEKYRQLMNESAASLPDNEAAYAPMLFERWESGVDYEIDTRVCYLDKLYKVLQAHTSQADWTPDVAVSLFAEVLIPDPSIIPEWVQPSSTNPYMKGDKVRHNDKVWMSDINDNVWEPGIYGWSEI